MAQTQFGGTLVRHGKDDYRWIDGTPAPGVQDESLNSHNFRISGGFVLVPERAARDPYNPELRFAADRLDAGQYQRVVYHRGMIPVPVADWDEQAKEPIGCTWPNEIE